MERLRPQKDRPEACRVLESNGVPQGRRVLRNKTKEKIFKKKRGVYVKIYSTNSLGEVNFLV